jgi:hypothetical protein
MNMIDWSQASGVLAEGKNPKGATKLVLLHVPVALPHWQGGKWVGFMILAKPRERENVQVLPNCKSLCEKPTKFLFM